MSVRVADRVDDWDQRPFEGGYAALQELADAEFSGVVRAGGAALYMTAGAVVGIEHGTIEDFESGSGTVFESPEAALPLLAVMQAADADVRAQYYTEETPISEVNTTLTDGGFTGFLELSENVLSGDYFLVYHGGNSMAVGFVGASERLIAGDEAFETADDEVGIYKVRQVDVEPIEIPAPDGETTAAAAVEAESGEAESATDAEVAEAEPEPAGEADPAPTESATEDDPASAEAAAAEEPTSTETADAEPKDAPATDEPTAADSAVDEPTDDEPATDEPTGGEPATDEPTGGEPAGAGTATAAEVEPAVDEAESDARRQSGSGAGHTASGGGQAASSETASRSGGRSTGGSQRGGTGGGRAQAGSAGQAGDLETRAIPSLDPDRTHVPPRQAGGSEPPARAEGTRAPQGGAAAEQPQGTAGAHAEQPTGGAAREAAGGGTASAELAELEDELADREAEIDRLESELEAAETDREELQAELDELVAERDELADEVERLEGELRRLEEELGAATDAERRMTPSEAIEGTNLFVDYDSKGDATLEKAHDGSESLEEVAENLQLGVHTEFEEGGVAVNGQEFDEFLRATLHYRFAAWLLGTLLFEIRDTGHAEALQDLYDAIPQIRRVEFNGAIDVEYTEDGQEKGGRERFDVIFRHRMGDPLVIANLNDSRDPATGGMMETLVTSGERVGQTADSLSAAFLVTSSFFESEALETVAQATQGGILSRDKRTSFVNLSRKQGYHLCLVAAREGNFHMEVPEL